MAQTDFTALRWARAAARALRPIASNANGFVFGNQVTGSPYTTGATMNAGNGTPCTVLTRRRGDQLGRIDIAVAPSNPNSFTHRCSPSPEYNGGNCGNATGCQLGAWATTDGGTLLVVLWQGSQGGVARKLSCGHATTRRTGTTRESRSIRTTPTAFSSTPSTSGLQRAPERRGTILTCGYSTARAGTSCARGPARARLRATARPAFCQIGNDGGAIGTSNADIAGQRRTRPWFNMDTGHEHDRVLLRRHQWQLR